MTKAVTFTARRYEAATVAFVEGCKAVDATFASKARAINNWASVSAAGIASGALTLKAVKEGLIARFPKAETLSDCGNTVKGQFYALQRVVNGDAGQRLIAGEALNTVARDTAPVQQQAKGKRAAKPSKGKAKARAITLSDACAALVSWLNDGLTDIERAKELARNPDIALVTATIGKLTQMVAKPAKVVKPGTKGKVAPSPRRSPSAVRRLKAA